MTLFDRSSTMLKEKGEANPRLEAPMPPRDISFRGPQFTEIACWMLVNPTHKEFEQRRGTQKVKSSQACMPERGPFSVQTVFVREN